MKPATVVIKKYGNRRLYDTVGTATTLPDSFAKARTSRWWTRKPDRTLPGSL